MFKPFIIGISGGSGAGKSTISFKLKLALKKRGFDTEVLEMDSYYKDLRS
jgi:uridine kinase